MHETLYKKIFKVAGSVTFLLLLLFFICIFYGALVQKGIIAKPEYLEISNLKYFIVPSILGVLGFGWLAVFSGNKVNCNKCKESILPKDKYGSRRLNFKPLINAIRGNNYCVNCVNKT